MIDNKTNNGNNWAFIDMQNLYKGIKDRGWKIKWELFRQQLNEKFSVSKAIGFLGFVPENRYLYKQLRNAGFILEFRRVQRLSDGTIIGGNVDADLASYVMDYKMNYDKAIVVADDGDYCRTLRSLKKQNKLKMVISSHVLKETSQLLIDEIGRNNIVSIHSLRNYIEVKNDYGSKGVRTNYVFTGSSLAA